MWITRFCDNRGMCCIKCIISLINSIQDFAVDVMRKDEEEVFGKL